MNIANRLEMNNKGESAIRLKLTNLQPNSTPRENYKHKDRISSNIMFISVSYIRFQFFVLFVIIPIRIVYLKRQEISYTNK